MYSDDRVVIPCGGEQTRWGHNWSKQLATVDGVTLLDRMTSQVRTHVKTPDILSSRADIVLNHPNALPGIYETLTDALGAYAKTRSGLVTIMLWDVYFTDVAAHKVLTWQGATPMFFGAHFEIHAAVIPAHTIIELAETSAVARKTDTRVLGKLWNLYYLVAYGVPIVVPHDWAAAGCFTLFGDETQDFDSYDQYASFVGKRTCA